MRCKMSVVRILLVSASSALLSIGILLLPVVSVSLKIFLQLGGVELCGCKWAFPMLSKRRLASFYFIMNGYGMLFGGILLAGQNTGLIRKISSFEVILLFALFTTLLWYLRKLGEKKMRQNRNLYQLELDFYGVKRSCIGLYDSGNSLYEPYLHRPVCILEEQVFLDLLERVPVQKKMMVPFHSIGMERGMMEAIEIPSMVMKVQGEKVEYKRVVFARSKESISLNKNYQVILHSNYCC